MGMIGFSQSKITIASVDANTFSIDGVNYDKNVYEVYSDKVERIGGVFTDRIGLRHFITQEYIKYPVDWQLWTADGSTPQASYAAAVSFISGIIGEFGSGGGSAPSDVAYGISWDGNTDAPTKNTVYDKIETITLGASTDDQNLILTGDVLSIEDGTGSVDLSTYSDGIGTDNQTLSTNPSTDASIEISGGNILALDESIQDVVGGMVTANTEAGIDVTYDDVGGKLNFNVTGGGTTQAVSPSIKSLGALETYDNSDVTSDGSVAGEKKYNTHTTNDTIVLSSAITRYNQPWIEQLTGADSLYIKKDIGTTLYMTDSVSAISADGLILKGGRNFATIMAKSNNVFEVFAQLPIHNETIILPVPLISNPNVNEVGDTALAFDELTNSTLPSSSSSVNGGLVSQLSGQAAVVVAEPNDYGKTHAIRVSSSSSNFDARMQLYLKNLTAGDVVDYAVLMRVHTGTAPARMEFRTNTNEATVVSGTLTDGTWELLTGTQTITATTDARINLWAGNEVDQQIEADYIITIKVQ